MFDRDTSATTKNKWLYIKTLNANDAQQWIVVNRCWKCWRCGPCFDTYQETKIIVVASNSSNKITSTPSVSLPLRSTLIPILNGNNDHGTKICNQSDVTQTTRSSDGFNMCVTFVDVDGILSNVKTKINQIEMS